MKTKMPIVKIIALLLLFSLATIILYLVNRNESKRLENNRDYLMKQVSIEKEKENEDVYSVMPTVS